MTGDWGEAPHFSTPRKKAMLNLHLSFLFISVRFFYNQSMSVQRRDPLGCASSLFQPPSPLSLPSSLLLSFPPALLSFLTFLPPPFLFSSLSPFFPLFSPLPHHILNFYSLVLFFSFLHLGFYLFVSSLSTGHGKDRNTE